MLYMCMSHCLEQYNAFWFQKVLPLSILCSNFYVAIVASLAFVTFVYHTNDKTTYVSSYFDFHIKINISSQPCE